MISKSKNSVLFYTSLNILFPELKSIRKKCLTYILFQILFNTVFILIFFIFQHHKQLINLPQKLTTTIMLSLLLSKAMKLLLQPNQLMELYLMASKATEPVLLPNKPMLQPQHLSSNLIIQPLVRFLLLRSAVTTTD